MNAKQAVQAGKLGVWLGLGLVLLLAALLLTGCGDQQGNPLQPSPGPQGSRSGTGGTSHRPPTSGAPVGQAAPGAGGNR